MEVAAVTLQQAGAQTNTALSMLKKNAQAEQSLATVLAHSAQSSPTSGRGQNLDVTV